MVITGAATSIQTSYQLYILPTSLKLQFYKELSYLKIGVAFNTSDNQLS